MRTKNFLKHLILGALSLTIGKVVGQSTTPGNVATFSTDFLGWDNTGTNNFPLMVRHDRNQPIDFYTRALHRMRINPDQTSTLNTIYTGVVQNGFVGISDQPLFFGGAGPFSRLHLVDRGTGSTSASHYAQQIGYRPWQRNGVTFTGNSDQAYVGQKYAMNESGLLQDKTDMVVQWSNDHTGEYGPDRLRFIFTANMSTGVQPYGSRSHEGLEAMRFSPLDDQTINAGLGDFYRGNLLDPTNVVEPTERLDVLNGNVRVRDLPSHLDDELEKFVVVDDDGVLHYRPLPAIPADNCDWTMNPTAPNHVSTAFGAADPDCPDAADAVGIGLDLGSTAPTGKLAVSNNAYANGINVVTNSGASDSKGMYLSVGGGSTYNYGLRADVTGGATRTYGVYATTAGFATRSRGGAFVCNAIADQSWGVSGEVTGGNQESFAVQGLNRANGVHNYGTHGRAEASITTGVRSYYGAYGRASKQGIGQWAYGVYGIAPVDSNSWAGWFEGKVKIISDLWHNTTLHFSDASLKTGVSDIENGHELLMGLTPRRYVYTPDAVQRMGLSTSEQFGFIAQEVGETLPQLVSGTVLPSEVDSVGVEIWPEIELKGVNYTAIIPLLVAGYQEQQATIAQQQQANNGLQEEVNELRSRLDQFEQTLAACCAAGAPTHPNDVFDGHGEKALDPALERLLLIAPNPFTDHTTVYYTLERHGRAQLLVNSADGRHIQVLHEGNLPAGEHRYDWSTAHLAPGVHYVTLLLDGEPIVKRAVKVR